MQRHPGGDAIRIVALSCEAALAVCLAHRLAVRATRVRLKSLEDVVLEMLDDAAR